MNNGIYKRYNVEWIGREGLASETHEEFLNDFINHFYKNVLKLVDRKDCQIIVFSPL
jgi:hypothetical protein